ncbi:hypothetical protein LY78DRAFT_319313 [Colletotrichum sublineola]|nr:hypothetical protein LY78DRAFT_319313 [Colletotrichum sublineola]
MISSRTTRETEFLVIETVVSASLYFPTIKMATPRANEEVLKVILTKLHRLETAFNQINTRLSTIESSIVPQIGTRSVGNPFSSLHLPSCPCASCINPVPPQQNRHEGNCREQPAAAAYKCSVDELRNRSDSNSSSKLVSVVHEEGLIHARNSEDQSRADHHRPISDYPSRPASLYDIFHHDMDPVIDDLKIPSSRYEDTTSHTEPMGSPVLSRSSTISSPKNSGSSLGASKSRNSSATLSSHPSLYWSEYNARNAVFKTIRGPIRRARSMRYRKTKSSTTQKNEPFEGSTIDTIPVDPTLIRRLEEKEFLRLYQIAQDSARACVTFGQRMMHVVTLKGGNQQLKLFHHDA